MAKAVRVACGLLALVTSAYGLDKLVWPTPNRAFVEGKSYESFIQPTASGDPISGLYGCVRSAGMQFHEGLDLLALKRDRRGEPMDSVFAAIDGTVVYVNRKEGLSAFGKYIVVEHTEEGLTYQTLYAHLAAVGDGVKVGSAVTAGERIGQMGHSASNGIPKERAHMHIQLQVQLSGNFEPWYRAQKFDTPNYHGNFNGYNDIGWDPLHFYETYREGKLTSVSDYIKALPTSVVAVVRSPKVPWFIKQNPGLLSAPLPAHIAGWQVEFTAEGLPKLWTPLTVLPRANLTLTQTGDEASCRKLRLSEHKADRDLKKILEILFERKF